MARLLHGLAYPCHHVPKLQDGDSNSMVFSYNADQLVVISDDGANHVMSIGGVVTEKLSVGRAIAGDSLSCGADGVFVANYTRRSWRRVTASAASSLGSHSVSIHLFQMRA